MREFARLHRHGAFLRRRAAGSVLITSLLALFLSQPFHAAARISAARLTTTAAATAVSGQQPAHGSPHDADLCSVCRATAQTRLGLRVALRLGEITAAGPCLLLQLPPIAPAWSAPQLRAAQPRAPPSTLLLEA